MSKQIILGFTTEGPTDVRFLESVIQRTFEEVAFECIGEIEVLPVQYIDKQGGNFVDAVKMYAQQADDLGVMVLCVHTDADAPSDAQAFNDRINPAFAAVAELQREDVCKNLVAIVPVQMTEAWLLADKELLKAEIGTNKNDIDLGIHKAPELYADPKQVIAESITLARQGLTRRYRRQLTIAELYLPLGQKVALNQLAQLPSYQKFKEAVRGAYRKLNYLY